MEVFSRQVALSDYPITAYSQLIISDTIYYRGPCLYVSLSSVPVSH